MNTFTPSFNVYEEINSTNNSDLDIRTLALLPTNVGVCDERVILKNTDELKLKCGLPTDNNYKYWYNIYNYLQYNNDGIFIHRLFNEDFKNYSMKLKETINYSNISTNIINNISNEKLYNTKLSLKLSYYETDFGLEVFDRQVTNDSNIAVAICSKEEDYNKSISNEYVESLRDINSNQPLSISTKLSNKYLILKDKSVIISTPTIGSEKTLLIVEGNKTLINSGDVCDINLNTTYLNLTVDTVESNSYRKNIVIDITGSDITVSGCWLHLIAGDKLNIENKTDKLNVVSVSYNNSLNESTITVTSILSLLITDSIYFSSNTTNIFVVENMTTDRDGWNLEILYGDWNSFTTTLVDYDYIYYDNEWLSSSKILTEKIYNVDEKNGLYSVTGDTILKLNKESLYYTQNQRVKKVYEDNLYKNNNVITFNDLMGEEVDFTDSFVIVILKRENGLFYLRDKFVLDYSIDSENRILQDSKDIYLKINTNPAKRVSTCDLSIEDLVIENNNINYDDISLYTNERLVNIINKISNDESYEFEFVLGLNTLIDGDDNLDITNLLAKSKKNCTSINGLWDESLYLGLTDEVFVNTIISHFGNKNYSGLMVEHNDYVSVFSNMKLQQSYDGKKNIWIPLFGDIAGMLIENKLTDISSVGQDIVIKNCLMLLSDIQDKSLKTKLNLNGINNILYSNRNLPVIFDSITNTPDLNSLMRELHKRRWSNIIKIDIKRLIFPSFLKLNNIDLAKKIQKDLKRYFTYLVDTINIISDYGLEIIINSTSMDINLTIIFNDILRTLNFKISISDGNFEVEESNL